MELLLDVLSWVCLTAGAFFAVVGGIGILRLPDFYSRMHGSALTDTLGAWLILLGLMFQSGLTLVTVKLVMIGLLLAFTSPTATHALAQSTLLSNIKPRVDGKEDESSTG